jgi:hypothetical protein
MRSNIKVVGITGKQGSGKDAVAGVFVHELSYERIAYADALKHVVSWMFRIPTDELWGPSEKRSTRTRVILQELGTDFARKHDPEIWLRLFNKRVDARHTGQNAPCYLVVPDIRFPEEVTNLKLNYDTRLIRVNRPGVEFTKDAATRNHVSETSVDLIPENALDFTVNNTGTLDDLQKMTRTIASLITWNQPKERNNADTQSADG